MNYLHDTEELEEKLDELDQRIDEVGDSLAKVRETADLAVGLAEERANALESIEARLKRLESRRR